jgi:hypothetical protein
MVRSPIPKIVSDRATDGDAVLRDRYEIDGRWYEPVYHTRHEGDLYVEVRPATTPGSHRLSPPK